jgi:hypothetical protein
MTETGTFVTATLLEDRNRERTSESPKVKFNASIMPVRYERTEKDIIRERKERNWNHILDKIAFVPKYPKNPAVNTDLFETGNPKIMEDYYSQFPIKPAFGFWKALALGDYPIEDLGINIPETFINIEGSYLMYTDLDTGKIVREPEVMYPEFEQNLEKQYLYMTESLEKHFLDEIKNDTSEKKQPIPEIPYVIVRGPATNDWLGSKFVWSHKALKENKLPVDNNHMMQRFLISKGEKACVTRLVYHTSNCNNPKGNYGIKIKNGKPDDDKAGRIFDTNPKKSLVNKSTINTDNKESFHITQMQGGSLREMERQAERVVFFLEKAYPVRIQRIVLDFLVDFKGTTWLINMRAAQMENAKKIPMALEEAEGKVSLDKLTCSVYCKLCVQIFKRDEARKTLTYKLLWELLQHLKKRGIHLPGITVSHNSTRQCRVCDLCYMLVVSEHELIDIEQKFARAQNIPIPNDCVRVAADQRPKHRPALLNHQLYQWRLLFYFTHVTDLEPTEAFDLKDLTMQYKFFTNKSTFGFHPLKDDLQRSHNGDSSMGGTGGGPYSFYESRQKKRRAQLNGVYSISAVRTHYFFSESRDVQNFLDQTNVEFRITKGKDWNDIVAQGSSTTLQYFKKVCPLAEGQKHQVRILCFFEDGRYCTVKGLVGLVCDDMINTETMNLYKHNGIYLPDEGFFNSNPFPTEWLEMFEKSDVLMEEYIAAKLEDHEHPKDQAYSAKCSNRDIEKMIDPIESRPKSNYVNVESKIPKRSFSANKLTQSKFGSQTNIGTFREKGTGEIENFKFSLLTDTAQKTLRPNTGTQSTKSMKHPLLNNRPVSSFFPSTSNNKKSIFLEEKAEKDKDLIDKEVELLSYLTKPKSATTKGHNNKKAAPQHIEQIKNLEKDLKAFDDDDLIKRYLGDDKVLEEQLIDQYFGAEDDGFSANIKQQGNQNNNNNNYGNNNKNSAFPPIRSATIEEYQQESQPQSSSQRQKVLDHNEFTAFLEQQKKKTSLQDQQFLINSPDSPL